MFKLFLGILVAVIALVLVAQAAGSDVIAEVSAGQSDSTDSREAGEQSVETLATQSRSPYHDEAPSLSGGGSGAMPK